MGGGRHAPPRKFWFLESISCILVTPTGCFNDNFPCFYADIIGFGNIYIEPKEWISRANMQPPNHQNNANRPTLIATLYCLGGVKSNKSISLSNENSDTLTLSTKLI